MIKKPARRVQPWSESPARAALDRVAELLSDAGSIVIVPPIALSSRPSLSAHLLQAAARRRGHDTRVFYASLSFTRWLGNDVNLELSSTAPEFLMGERLFAAAAYGVPHLGRGAREALAPFFNDSDAPRRERLSLPFDELERLSAEFCAWADDVAARLAQSRAKVIGCTSIFEQTAASIAILRRVKALAPGKITILGGANCMAEMADGVASLSPDIDYVFSGEGEEGWPDLLERIDAGGRPSERVLHGRPVEEMDALPIPSYDDFYRQTDALLEQRPAVDRQWMPFETSRGCWWGRKATCTFCGLNGDALELYRQKSPERVIAELTELLGRYPPRKVMAYDNIMPATYFRTLLPALAGRFEGCTFFFEQKANIRLPQMQALKAARFDLVQPGIEALNSRLLRLMSKGVGASQNIATLRYGRACRVSIYWNLLYGFPGDAAADYEEMLALLPLLRHLAPPSKLGRINLDRFSPYFMAPERYGITDIEPLPVYRDVLPAHADVERIAYKFLCRYPSGILERPDLIAALDQAVVAWRGAWLDEDEVYSLKLTRSMEDERLDAGRFPDLWISRGGDGAYVLVDTRGLPGVEPRRSITRGQAAAALASRRYPSAGGEQPDVAWALENKVAVELDGLCVALAVAAPELIAEFEAG